MHKSNLFTAQLSKALDDRKRFSANGWFGCVRAVNQRHNFPTCGLNIIVDNVGNKKAEDIHIWVELTTKILDYSIEAGVEYRARKTENCIQIDNLSLNPTESLSVSIQCKRDPDRSNYVSNIKITHSEGIGLNFQDTEFQVEEVIESVFKSVIWRI